MKAFLSILLLVSLAAAQAGPGQEFDKTTVHIRNPPGDKNEWRVLPAYQPKPSWVSRHKTATVLLFLGAGVGVGIGIERATRQSCGHYEYGQSGVNVNCPKEVK